MIRKILALPFLAIIYAVWAISIATDWLACWLAYWLAVLVEGRR